MNSAVSKTRKPFFDGRRRNRRPADSLLLGLVCSAIALLIGGFALAVFAAPPASAPAKATAAAPAKSEAAKAAPVPAKPAAAPATKAETKPTAKPVATPAAKPAAKPLPTVTDPVSFVGMIIRAFQSGQWMWGIALIITLLTWAFNRFFKSKIPPKFLPWIALGLATIANFFAGWGTGLSWYDALGKGVTTGLAAAGGWSALMKYILPASSSSSAQTPTTEKAS